ncbi:MAG TPA: OmpA family protein [Blastocatellia bacterium]|nr:OmpA family protein [Blastocatellia bacterium]
MKNRIAVVLALSVFVLVTSSACATKKYARNRVNERVTPLEQRAGELEETSRRNSQDISKIGDNINEVRGRTDRAQSQADAALARAGEANTRAGNTEQSLGNLKANLDKYSLQNTAAVNFKFDSHELTPEAQEALDQIASQIKDRGNFILEIQGFADSTGTDGYNNQLTQKRADAVRRYLAEQHNIPLFRMHILGFGEVRAVADNRTREGRAQNRRVEVRLLTRGINEGSTAQTTSTSQK